jgi:hypothetical protein
MKPLARAHSRDRDRYFSITSKSMGTMTKR